MTNNGQELSKLNDRAVFDSKKARILDESLANA